MIKDCGFSMKRLRLLAAESQRWPGNEPDGDVHRPDIWKLRPQGNCESIEVYIKNEMLYVCYGICKAKRDMIRKMSIPFYFLRAFSYTKA